MRVWVSVVVGLSVAAVVSTSALAQDYEPPPPSAPPPPPTRFVMPDIQDSWMDWSRYDGRLFSTRLSLVPIIDYTGFSQDADSIAQVKQQKSQWDVRTFRIMFRGQFKLRVPVDYFVSFEVKGKDHVTGAEDSKLGWTDLYLSTKIPRVGKVFFGKVKEPWVYEMVGDAANLQQEERVLNPFFVSRNIGFRLQNTFADDRMSWAAGWFNDWWVVGDSYGESGNTFSARLTGLPYWQGDGGHYVHLGLSARYNGADKDTMQFRGRPESNISSYYVDTGTFPATHASEVGVEGIWGNGPVFVTSEYVRAGVDAIETGNPSFQGGYVAVSYVLSGEHRPYDRSVAYARRVMPKSRWGAWEIFTRYSHVDLDDRVIAGGIYDRGTIGLTWWATRHWRLGLDYGITDLDRFGAHGVTRSVHPRFQWVY